MKDLVSYFDKLPKALKILLAIPLLDICWVIYRICLSANKQNTLGFILGLILLFVGLPFLWLVDIVTLILYDKVLWID